MAERFVQQQALTFVVRLWCEANDCGCEHWRARVEHVGTREVRYVDDVAAISDVMARWTRVREEPANGEDSGLRNER